MKILKEISLGIKIIFGFFSRYLKLIIVGFLVSLTPFFLKQIAPSLLRKISPETRYIGVVGRYSSIDDLPREISGLISYGIVQKRSNGEFTVSPIVKSISVDNDGKNYVIKFVENKKWHDGKLLTAKDFSYKIKEGEIVFEGKETVKINLKEPFSPLLSFLSKPLIKDDLVGLGPYRIRKVKKIGGIVKMISLSPVKNKNDQRLIFYFYKTEAAAITGFKAGEIDEVWKVTDLSEIKNWQNLNIVTRTLTEERYAALFFNTRKDPFSEKRLRQALAYAIEKPEKEERTLSPIPPTSWAYNPNIKSYSFNVSRAKRLLKNVNFDQQITINLYAHRSLLDWAEKIKKSWEENLAIKTEIIPYDDISSFMTNFDLILGYGLIPPDPDQYSFWHSTQKETNITGYSNPRIDQLLEQGRRTADPEKRKEVYQDFQRFLVEDAPVIFLFYPKVYNISRG